MNYQILLIDDEPNIKNLLAKILTLEGFKVDSAENASAGLSLLEIDKYDILITDVKLPDADGVSLVKKIKDKYSEMEIIVITAYGNINDGVSAMKNGAYDYIVKGGDGDEVILSVKNALEKIELKNQVSNLKKRIDSNYGQNVIVSKSEEVQKALELAGKVAVTDSTVLLLGETGTGKELFAQLIHNLSMRSNKPFVAINCSAIPKDIQESELFGYIKGAFTGAIKDKKGFFEEADGGTFFLDEVADMNIDTQAKLLRFLETGTFVKVGDTKQTKIDVRVISATNKDINSEVEKGLFRKDLYYRLNSFTISLPSLKERKEDIEALANYFLNNSKKILKKVKSISPEFIQKLLSYSWPGNIRELKNVIERAVILADGDSLTPNLLPKEFFENNQLALSNSNVTLEELEKNYILKIYNETNQNKALTAKKLDIGNATLYRKLKEYGIE